jgi:ribosomal protein L7Ae-like RNA K-turn-binding protein
METSEQLTGGAVQAPDLAEVAGRPGPFLSLYLNTERDVEKAAQRSETRWKAVRSDLEGTGVPAGVLGAVDELVPDAHLEGECLAVIADRERVLHVEHGTAVDPNDLATWAPLPRLVPILEWRQSEPPYAVVLTDRTGADLFGFVRGLPDAIRGEVEGDHDEIRKVAPGGWSQRRFQDRAEDSWRENAEQVGERVTRLVERTGAELVIVAGDVRAVELLRKSLPDRLAELVHVVEGERPWDGKGDPLPEETRDLVERHVRETTERLLARFEEERGQHDKAVEGLDATTKALQQAQVATLFVTADAGDDRRLWFGPEPTLVATTDRELKELGVDSPEEGTATDALVRAALGTAAGVRVLDEGDRLRDRVGALLRWSSS